MDHPVTLRAATALQKHRGCASGSGRRHPRRRLVKDVTTGGEVEARITAADGAEPQAMRGAPVTTAAHFRPARFQALLADSTLTATSAAPGTVSSGVNVAPGSASGPWISSLTIVTW